MEIKTLHLEKLSGEAAEKIQRALRRTPGVEKVQADPAHASVTVTFDENQIGLLALEKKLRDLGYPVKGSE